MTSASDAHLLPGTVLWQASLARWKAGLVREGRAVFLVENSGPVVPSAELQRLFQPFQTMAPARTGDGNGAGLGLSVVQAIATAHGAEVTAVSRPEA